MVVNSRRVGDTAADAIVAVGGRWRNMVIIVLEEDGERKEFFVKREQCNDVYMEYMT